MFLSLVRKTCTLAASRAKFDDLPQTVVVVEHHAILDVACVGHVFLVSVLQSERYLAQRSREICHSNRKASSWVGDQRPRTPKCHPAWSRLPLPLPKQAHKTTGFAWRKWKAKGNYAKMGAFDERAKTLDLREKLATFAPLEVRGCGEIGRHGLDLVRRGGSSPSTRTTQGNAKSIHAHEHRAN